MLSGRPYVGRYCTVPLAQRLYRLLRRLSSSVFSIRVRPPIITKFTMRHLQALQSTNKSRQNTIFDLETDESCPMISPTTIQADAPWRIWPVAEPAHSLYGVLHLQHRSSPPTNTHFFLVETYYHNGRSMNGFQATFICVRRLQQRSYDN